MKKIFLSLVILMSLFIITGCGKEKEKANDELRGKYIYDNGDAYGYYDCNSKTCKWHMTLQSINGTSNTEYSYKMQKFTDMYDDVEKENEEYKNIYLVTFTEIGNNNTTYSAFYNYKKDEIYDVELDIIYKKEK